MGFNLDAFLTQPEHDSLDHDGLIGVGPFILPLDATGAELQTALNTYEVVQLSADNYTANPITTTIFIPPGKTLIGAYSRVSGAFQSSRHRLNLGTGGGFTIQDDAAMIGIEVQKTTGDSQNIIQLQGTTSSAIGCTILVSGGSQTGDYFHCSNGVQGFILRDCHARGPSILGVGGAGFRITSAGNEITSIVENCHAQQIGDVGFNLVGGHYKIFNCGVTAVLSHGFDIAFINTHTVVRDCYVDGTGNAGHAFRVTNSPSGGWSSTLDNCVARSAVGDGFNLVAVGANAGQLLNCRADTSSITGTDFVIGAGWTNINNLSI
jgi:hypothetical protein